MGLCDLHCHILPEIDDGKVSTQNFERMLQLYRESGITALAFTPHIYNPYVTTDLDALRERYLWAESIATELGIRTYLGSELFVGEQKELRCIPIAGIYCLVEFSLTLPPANLIPRLKALRDQGYTIIIAHIERYRWLKPSLHLFEQMLSLGVLVQANVEAVEQGAVQNYLEEDLVDIFATDNHGDESLPSRLLAALNDWPKVYARMEKMML